jgi:shikimate kinase
MLKAYMSKPRAVLWRRDAFTKQENETNERALRQSYPTLLSQRERLYESYSDCRIDYYNCRKKNLQTQDFLDLIDLKDA